VTIVGITKINQIDLFLRKSRNKAIRFVTRQIDQTGISAGSISLAGVTGHNIRININRVNRVHNGNPVLRPENIEDVAAITLGAVRDKDLVGGCL
jgi:hypothetical protein